MAKAKSEIHDESWINRYWRPLAAITYLVICICDFILFPWIFGLRSPTPGEIALAVKDLDPAVGAVIAAPRPQWQPLTLMGGGLVHVAFGAIVGVTAWTRGVAHIEGIKNRSLDPYNQAVDQLNQPTQPTYNPYQPQYNPYSQPPYGQTPYGQPPYGQPPMTGQAPGSSATPGEEVDNPDL